MLRILQTFDAENINDGSDYQAWLLNPYNTPAAQTVFLAQANADSEDTGVFTVEAPILAVRLFVKNYANRVALTAQLQSWFKRGKQADLVVLFSDDGVTYSKPCRVVNLVQDPENSLYFTALLQTGWTTWRAVNAETYNWTPISGTGGNHTIDLQGDDETPLSVTFSLSAGPATGYLYQRLYQLLAVAGVPAMGLDPWCITLDTAALIADNANKCQVNQGGGINASVTTIPYDTVTGSIPSAGSGYVGTEQIKWTGKTGTTSGNLTGVTRGIGGTTAASHADDAEIKLSYILANGADLRVFVDQRETNRWIANMNNASTKIWLNINLTRPGYALALGTAIVSTADISYITFADTPNVYAAIAALPAEVILVHGTEWMKCRRVDNSSTVRRLAVIQRGVMGTTKQTHAVGDVFSFMEHVITVPYGNVLAVEPSTLDATYDYTKPLFNLSSSTNAAWVYDNTTPFFVVARQNRTGGFRPGIQSRLGKDTGTYLVKRAAVSGDPAMGMAMITFQRSGSWFAEQASLVWSLYRACGIDTTTMAGEKYRSTTGWPALTALQVSEDGVTYTAVWTEVTPASINTWTALGSHSGVDMSDRRWIRLIFEGSIPAGVATYALFEIQSATVNFVSANLPSGSLLNPAQNAQLILTFSNGANEDAFVTNVPMLLGLTLALDADERTILYNNVNAHDGIILNNEARDWWIRLSPGSNPLTIAGTDVGTLTAALSWRRRRF